ncbi:MFS transporter [Ammoniphilus sp. 3BR4]|uniref:MFS transporter n=1 Tax=Ammoniphilus sp. 3BR4 TaxID=3158265 RepID=UPI00346501A9
MSTYTVHEIKNEQLFYIALRFNILITVMNTTMFNVALPAISGQWLLSPSSTSWIVTGYSVMFAIGTVTYSRLTDQYPIKYLITIGLSLLGIGSVMGMLAHNLYLLLAARLIQASGASCVSGVGMVITNRYIPAHRRGEAMGKVASSSTLAFGLGPLVGGLVVQYWGWSYLFLITLFAFFMLPVYYKQLPSESRNNQAIDWVGLMLLSAGVISLLLVISTKNLYSAIGIIFFFLLWAHIQRIEKPFIHPDLLRNKRYVCSLFIGFLVFFINFSVMFLVPLLLASLFHAQSALIGLIIFPGAFGSAVASLFIGRWLDRVDSTEVIGIGILIMFLSVSLFSSFGYHSMWLILLFYFLCGIGFACISAGVPHFLSKLLNKDQFATAMGLQQLLQFFGGAFGVACTGMILDAGHFGAVNGLWYGSGMNYSNAFLSLQFISLLAGCVLWVQRRAVMEKNLNL